MVRVELSPIEREFVALTEQEFARAQAERQRRLLLLFAAHDIPPELTVTFENGVMSYVLPAPEGVD